MRALKALWVPKSESEPFIKRYGSQRNSRNLEELFIRDHFEDRRNGVFLDVGANHYQRDSNTYFLETALGWSGIAVEPLTEFAADYATYRPRTRFVGAFASNVENGSVAFFVPPTPNKLMASSTAGFAQKLSPHVPTIETTVPATTLNDVLRTAGIAKLDFMSMDIELAEPQALAGFDIDRYRPELVCIESHRAVRQAILDYFQEHGYVVVGKYLRADPVNLYFRPAP
jgi:FkbM family methyltransferase